MKRSANTPRAREHPLHFRLPVHESKDRVGTDAAPAQIGIQAQGIDRNHLDPVVTGQERPDLVDIIAGRSFEDSDENDP
jgi:hypothetical protein